MYIQKINLFLGSLCDIWFKQTSEVKLIYFLCFIFFTSFLLTICLLFFFKFRKNRKTAREKKIFEQFNTFFYSNLFIDNQQFNLAIRKQFETDCLNKKLHRKVLLDVLLDLKKKFSGEVSEKIIALYYHFHLEKNSLKKINSIRYYQTIEGMRELTIMRHPRAVEIAKKLLFSKKEIVRAEAQISLIMHNGFDGLFFLDNYKEDIPQWQQICLLNALNQFQRPEKLNLNSWITSTNSEVQYFALLLIKHFNYVSDIELFIQLKDSKIDKIRNLLAQIIGHLFLFQYVDLLLVWLKKEENTIVKESILNSLYEIGGVEVIPQLIELVNEAEFDLAMKAVKILHRYQDKIDFQELNERALKLLSNNSIHLTFD